MIAAGGGGAGSSAYCCAFGGGGGGSMGLTGGIVENAHDDSLVQIVLKAYSCHDTC